MRKVKMTSIAFLGQLNGLPGGDDILPVALIIAPGSLFVGPPGCDLRTRDSEMRKPFRASTGQPPGQR